MALVNVNSDILANVYAAAPVANPTYLDTADPYVKIGTVSVNSTDNVGSTYRLCQVGSNDLINNIQIVGDALGGTTALSLGLYNQNGGVVVSVALFTTATTFVAAQFGTSVRFSAVLPAASAKKRVWELLALPADSKLIYDLVLTSTVAATTTGTVAVLYTFQR